MSAPDRPAGLPDDLAVLDQVRPRYGEASLAELLPGVAAALGVPGLPDPLRLADDLAGVRRIAVLLADGLGAHLLPLALPYAPTLSDLSAGRLSGGQRVPGATGTAAGKRASGTIGAGGPTGVLGTTRGDLAGVRVLTAGFPSTTPVSLVTLGTGVPPGSHGVLGFTVNVPGTDRVLVHIRWRDDPDPRRWQPVPPVFATTAAAGIATTTVNRPEFAGSGLTVAMIGTGRYRPATDPDALAEAMLAELSATGGPALVYGYHHQPDGAGHEYGVGTAEWIRAVSGLDRLLTRLVDGLPPGTALLVTADHGQLNVPADQRYELAALPELTAGLRLATGEPRVRYLHTRPGATGDVVDAWRGLLGDAAWVATREEAVADGWFGPVPPEHLPRIGDVVVASRGRAAILNTGPEPDAVARLVGMHGSFTAAEMRVPLLIARR